MQFNLEFYAVIVAEVLFILFVGAVIRLVMLRKKINSLTKRMLAHDRMVQELTDKLVSAQVALKTGSAAKGMKSTQSSVGGAPHTEDLEELLLSYKQRVENLERFRKLYFDLEGKYEENRTDNDAYSVQIRELIDVIGSQEELIADLKRTINDLSQRISLDAGERVELEQIVGRLEGNAEELSYKMEDLERYRMKYEKLQKDVDFYRNRADQLEDAERRLQRESKRYRQEFETLSDSQRKPAFGQVKVVEIERMSKQLLSKEDEIRRLRTECETIARQYETLAISSMDVSVGGAGSVDRNAGDLAQLKVSLEESIRALAKKQSECEQLENLYLQLKDQGSKQAADILQKSLSEREVLELEVQDLTQQADVHTSDACQEQLSALSQTLKEKEKKLRLIRQSYQELKEQFVEIANEDSSLKQAYDDMRQENSMLRLQVETMKDKVTQASSYESQINALRTELSKMEDRYLKLKEKSVR